MDIAENKLNNAERVTFLEENKRHIQISLELALTLGDFQNEINNNCSPERIFKETENRIGSLMGFEARAFYFVDLNDSDLLLSVC